MCNYWTDKLQTAWALKASFNFIMGNSTILINGLGKENNFFGSTPLVTYSVHILFIPDGSNFNKNLKLAEYGIESTGQIYRHLLCY